MSTSILSRSLRHALMGVLLFFAACNNVPQYPEQLSQDEAMEIVWRQVYGMKGYAPPRIEWMLPHQLDCGNGVAFNVRLQVGIEKGRPVMGDKCVYGIFWPYTHHAQIAWQEGATYSTTAFAHELYHVALAWRRVPDNGDHSQEGFQEGGEVSKAIEALRAAGL